MPLQQLKALVSSSCCSNWRGLACQQQPLPRTSGSEMYSSIDWMALVQMSQTPSLAAGVSSWSCWGRRLARRCCSIIDWGAAAAQKVKDMVGVNRRTDECSAPCTGHVLRQMNTFPGKNWQQWS
jgi:hypothetical protein